MSIEILTLLMIGGIVLLIIVGVPLAFVTGTVAMVLALSLFGPAALTLVASRTYSLMSEFVLVAVPMFILMASIMERSGVAHDHRLLVRSGQSGFRAGRGRWAWFAAYARDLDARRCRSMGVSGPGG